MLISSDSQQKRHWHHCPSSKAAKSYSQPAKTGRSSSAAPSDAKKTPKTGKQHHLECRLGAKMPSRATSRDETAQKITDEKALSCGQPPETQSTRLPTPKPCKNPKKHFASEKMALKNAAPEHNPTVG